MGMDIQAKEFKKLSKRMSFNSKQYWEDRYKGNGNSGRGSYDEEAEKKANYINHLIIERNIKTINDYGHGDGNQLKYFVGFQNYCGFDVSETARKKCEFIFSKDPKYKFIKDDSMFKFSDLVLSLDVLYHLTEMDVYKDYLKKLFSIGKYVLIYAVDDDVVGPIHYQARKFTPYISEKFPEFELVEITNLIRSHVSMYLYKKKS